MGFLQRAKAGARSFLGNVQKQAKSFIGNLPSHLTSTRKAITQINAGVQKAGAVVNHLNAGVQSNDAFGTNLKDKSAKFNQFSDLGLQKIDQYHKGADQFLNHVA